MSCDSIGQEERRKNQFMKIQILDAIVGEMIGFGVQYGLDTLPDTVDLSSGAVPEGNYEDIIDPSAPHQYLSMYTKIAEARFACVVTEMLRADKRFYSGIVEICRSFPKRLVSIEGKLNAPNAYNLFNQIVLDGMPCDETREILTMTEDKVEWIKKIDTHAPAWEKCSGDLNQFYILQTAFVEGLFEGTGIKYTNENNKKFSLTV